MRITKAWLRNKKIKLTERMNEIARLSDDDLKKEHQRIFPYRNELERPAFASGLRRELLIHMLDQDIPDSLCQ
jgi:hypothetical protein